MSFLELFGSDLPAVESEEDAEEHQPPPWFGPSDAELGVAITYNLVLGRSTNGVVALPYAIAYSSGVAFELVTEVRGLKESQTHRLFHAQHGYHDDEDLDDAFMRFGVEYADGRRASNLAGRRGRQVAAEDKPILSPHRGGGGSGHRGRISMRPGYWLWPLPPSGPLKLYCQWPIADIPLTTVEIDAGALVEAAGKTVPLWDES